MGFIGGLKSVKYQCLSVSICGSLKIGCGYVALWNPWLKIIKFRKLRKNPYWGYNTGNIKHEHREKSYLYGPKIKNCLFIRQTMESLI